MADGSVMTLYGLIFYLLGGIILAATLLAITSRNVMHAIVYLIVSFFGMAPVFYLLGAPLLALLEIIIYAGAIMVLFIFIVMMLKIEVTPTTARGWLRQWVPALSLSAVSGAIMVFLIWQEPANQTVLPLAMAGPQEFGRFVYSRYWFAVEIASFLLFVALVGAYYLGRRESGSENKP
jgi:NADH-quinone oxidoreductase subunit J